MRLSKFSASAPSTHSHTRCSRTGSDRQLKLSCRLGHSFREAKTPKRVEEFFGFSKFWISADKRRSCVISNAVFGALFKLLAPSKNLHRGEGHGPRPPCQRPSTPLGGNQIVRREIEVVVSPIGKSMLKWCFFLSRKRIYVKVEYDSPRYIRICYKRTCKKGNTCKQSESVKSLSKSSY